MSGQALKERVRNLQETVLSTGWAVLKRYTFDYQRRDGGHERQTREVFERGDSVSVLPFDPDRGTILLVRQFRLPAYLRGEATALIEACAGMLDGEAPETRALKEAEEELGYRLGSLNQVCRIFPSPGAASERIWCFTATYSPEDKVSDGGGKADEGEDIEVLEMPLEDAFAMIATGEIMDAKTILLIQHLAVPSRPPKTGH